MVSRKTFYLVGIVLVAVFLAVGYLSSQGGGALQTTTVSQTGTAIPVVLTDPAFAPQGTGAIIASYSGIQVHTTGSGWIGGAGSGTVDLLSLANTSQTIGSVTVPNGSTIDMARFNITGGQIVIGGSTYPLVVPGGSVTVNFGAHAAGSGTGVIIDLSPAIGTLYTANSSSYVLSPSAAAIFATNMGAYATIGGRQPLQQQQTSALAAAKASISITSAALASVGGSSNLSVTVKNTGNANTTLRDLLVSGSESVSLVLFTGNRAAVNASSNQCFVVFGPTGCVINVTKGPPQSNATANSDLKLAGVGIQAAKAGLVEFVVMQDGALQPATDVGSFSGAGSGYTLAAGASATLAFSGSISLGMGHISISFVPGSSYRMVSTGDGGAGASVNVTAGT